jgi:hypothetical protein
VIKSRKKKWARHAARMGKVKNSYKSFVGKPEGYRDHSKELEIEGWITLSGS